MGFLAAVVMLNWMEATFKGLSAVWLVFYIIAMDYPVFETNASDESFEYGISDETETTPASVGVHL